MQTRREEKERLREIREAKEAEAKRREKRLAATYGVAAVLAIGLVAAAVFLVSSATNNTGSAEAAFGTHYEGLEERRAEAEVPTMAEGGGSHFHPLLAVYANGKPIEVPANIGIDPAKPQTEMAGLHTHDDTGTIHNEAGTGATLGDFFAVWGVPLSSSRLGPHQARGDKTVRMWVDGKPSKEFEDLKLEDGQQIVLSFDSKQVPPPPLRVDGGQ